MDLLDVYVYPIYDVSDTIDGAIFKFCISAKPPLILPFPKVPAVKLVAVIPELDIDTDVNKSISFLIVIPSPSILVLFAVNVELFIVVQVINPVVFIVAELIAPVV